MENNTPTKKLLKIPDHVREVLLSDESAVANDIIKTTYNLKDERLDEYFRILRELTVMDLPVEDLPNALKDALQLDGPTANKLAVDTVGLRLMPLQDWLGDVRQYIPKWGGTSDKYFERLQKMFSLRFVHREIFDPIYSKHELGELNVEEFERLDNLIISYVNGKRDEAEMEEALRRSKEKGGMGFDEGKAKGFVEDLNELIENGTLNAELVNEAKKKRDAVITAEQIPGAVELMRKDIEVPDSVKGQEEVQDAIREVDLEEEEQQAALPEKPSFAPEYKTHVKVREEKEPLPAPTTGLDFNMEEDIEEVDKIGAETGATKSEVSAGNGDAYLRNLAKQFEIPEELVDRWMSNGSAYLKDVKNTLEFRDTLTKPIEQGGLAMKKEMSDKVVRKLRSDKQVVMAGGELESEASVAQPTKVDPTPAKAKTPAEAAPAPMEPTPVEAPEPTQKKPKTMLQPEPAPEATPAPATQPKPEAETPAVPVEPTDDYFRDYFGGAPKPQAAAMQNTAPTPQAAAPEAVKPPKAPKPPAPQVPEKVTVPKATPPAPPDRVPASKPQPQAEQAQPKPATPPKATQPSPPERVPAPQPAAQPAPEKKHPQTLNVPGQETTGEKPAAVQPPVAPAPTPSLQQAEAIIKKEKEGAEAREKQAEQKTTPVQGPTTKKIVRPPESAPGKTPIVEVKPPETRIMGPREELAQMTAEIFRDFSASPEEATTIMREKIELFKEQGMVQYNDAINAWKASPLNQLLLEIGATSAEQGKPVEQVIQEREAAGQPTLTMEEFNALLDLNKQLEY